MRVALGGVRDEAEIRGHRRTYVGAQPGRIVRALTEAGTMNPVVLLDEVDKVGSDWRGDPSAALLEVLDPAQNHTFRDHYVEVDLDLSDVLFIATANVLDTDPRPAARPARDHPASTATPRTRRSPSPATTCSPRQIRSNGLEADEVSVSEAALRGIVAGYTREAGVRELERQLGKALRKVAVRVAGGATVPVVVDAADLVDLLGRQRFHAEDLADRVSVPGVATGLAVTGAGGDVLVRRGLRFGAARPSLQVTGQLGDVMKESAQIALSWVRSHRRLRRRRRHHRRRPGPPLPRALPRRGRAQGRPLAPASP